VAKINLIEKPLINHTIDSSSYHNKADSLPAQVPFLNQKLIEDFERILSKYPAEQKFSAVIPILTLCQVHNGGHLTEEIVLELAEYLEVEAIKIFEVATFYSMFNHQPQGKYQLCVCQGVSCLLNGYEEVITEIMTKLNIKNGETSEDGLFSLKKVECLGACGGAPVMMVGDNYHENLTPDSIKELIDSLQS
jgi:NADH-quinone oxidoreductase subunit E